MIVIGVAGPAGAGKDTVGDYLHANHGFQKMSFAAPLKRMLAAAGLAEPLDRAKKEELIPGLNFSWRHAAQTLGTQWGREQLDPNLWVKLVRREILALAEKRREETRIVLTDVRFENEAAMVRELGGQVWHLKGRRAELGAAAGHVSEKEVLFYPHQDELIDNRENLHVLHLQIEDLFEGLKEKKNENRV